MSNDKIIILKNLEDCYDISGNLSFKKMKAMKGLIKSIENITKFLDNYSPTLAERVFCLKNNIQEIPTCSISGKKLKFPKFQLKKLKVK
jgi:hypothetical protein